MAGSWLRSPTWLRLCRVSLPLKLSVGRFTRLFVNVLMAVNVQLTRLRERRVYFVSRLEGLGHYDGEGRRNLRWPVGHLSQEAKGHQ